MGQVLPQEIDCLTHKLSVEPGSFNEAYFNEIMLCTIESRGPNHWILFLKARKNQLAARNVTVGNVNQKYFFNLFKLD